jgi:alpha-beta hydrolase superfamily lysophospholipase
MTNSFRASDGTTLQYRRWAPTDRPPRATVLALHGIQSHGGWYLRSSQRLADAGFEVTFLDRRGSGLSTSLRGHALHADRLINDVAHAARAIRMERGPECPLILMGVSWGGKLALASALAFPKLFDATALLYPGLCPFVRPTWYQHWRLWWAQAVGWGHVRVAIPLNDPALFTDTPQWREFIRRDELALHRVTVDFLAANLDLNQRLETQLERVQGNALLMLAGRDAIIDNNATRALFARMTSAQRTVIEYPAARHTLEFEPDPEPFFQDLIAWMESLPGVASEASSPRSIRPAPPLVTR